MLEETIINLEKEVKILNKHISKLIELMVNGKQSLVPKNAINQTIAVEAVQTVDCNDAFEGNPLDAVKKALMNLAKEKGRDTAKELLSEFNATKLSDLKPEDYLDLIEKANFLMEE